MPISDHDTKKPPIQEPDPGKPPVNIDADDAMIQEPEDDAFKKPENPGRKVPR